MQGIMSEKRRDGSRVLESAVESHLETQMRRIGGRAFKFPPAVKGAPDRIVVFPHGRIFFVELKRKGEKPSPSQKLWHERMDAMGHVVHILDSREQVNAFIEWAAHSEWTNDRDGDVTAVVNNYRLDQA